MEVEEVVEYLRFRLIAKKSTLLDLLALFDSDSEDEWSQQYISMMEVRQTFSEKTGLDPERSLLLARYLIEDVEKEHVYTDDLNENLRSIVKSIIRNLFGDYEVNADRTK